MTNRSLLLVTLLLVGSVFALTTESFAFGQNKVQYRYFKWKYLTTEHFNLYYNQGGLEAANFAAEVAEEAYEELARRLRYSGAGDEPITMVTYQSHNDFEQTNVTGAPPDESTGGFTEFLKTRVVVPFEGDHERFRHVIHHELTHAMMLNLLYGQGFGAVLSGVSQARVPLWFIEGLAEYHSRGGLDLETEMVLRDAVVNDILPEIFQLNEMGYLGVYKCGQSILYYIAFRYGDEKIGEILHQMKGLRDFDRALKVSIGIDQEELSKRWRQFFKERYWPQVAKLDPPSEHARPLTDHKKEFCYINNSPSLSPNGEYIAFLSDRSDYFDVYLMNTLDGKVLRRLVHGQRTGQFEELHWLRPGISWSPDGKQIALAAKAGANDAIHIIDVENGDVVRSISYQNDGLFSPAWSPDGEKMAFIYVQDGRSDLAVVDLASDNLTMLTSDLFDDADPSWAPDSKSLLFTSNRGDLTGADQLPDGRTMNGLQLASFDIFKFDLESSSISRLTNENKIIRTPVWTPLANTILYVSSRSGAFNLYTHNLTTGEVKPLSNLATGALQPSLAWKSHALAFTSYYDVGYDVYMIHAPFDQKDTLTVEVLPPAAPIPEAAAIKSDFGVGSANYSEFVFDRTLSGGSEAAEPEKEEVDSTKAPVRSKQEDGVYPSHDYEVKLSPDYVSVSASYSPYFRAQGSGMVLFTDVLGNHDLYLSADFNRSTENSNFFMQYVYLARRMDLGLGVYHFAYPFYSNRAIRRDRNYGLFIESSYPLNRYNRFEFGTDFGVVERSDLIADPGYERPKLRRSTLMPHVGYVHDTSIWRRSVAPSNGERWRLDWVWSPNLGLKGEGFSFTTFAGDYRKYFAFRKDYTFAFRVSGASSYGRDPQRFFLGGVQNWFNPRYDNPQQDVQIDDIRDIYYSSFVGPLRGVGYYNQIGETYALFNAEFRYPFIRHLMFGWPLPIYIRDLQGALFTDYGAAWFTRNSTWPKDDAFGFGVGLRIDLGIFPIEWDVAWSPDPRSNMVPMYYFSINIGF